MFLTIIGKSRACSTVLASFKATSDKHGYMFELPMQMRDKKQQLNGSGGESRCGDGNGDVMCFNESTYFCTRMEV
jgi:hypothetical protein